MMNGLRIKVNNCLEKAFQGASLWKNKQKRLSKKTKEKLKKPRSREQSKKNN